MRRIAQTDVLGFPLPGLTPGNSRRWSKVGRPASSGTVEVHALPGAQREARPDSLRVGPLLFPDTP